MSRLTEFILERWWGWTNVLNCSLFILCQSHYTMLFWWGSYGVRQLYYWFLPVIEYTWYPMLAPLCYTNDGILTHQNIFDNHTKLHITTSMTCCHRYVQPYCRCQLAVLHRLSRRSTEQQREVWRLACNDAKLAGRFLSTECLRHSVWRLVCFAY